MKRAQILTLLGGLTITWSPALVAVAQDQQPLAQLDMNGFRLMLIPGIRTDALGKEEILTIRLSNEGETTLSFPAPRPLCGDSRDGFVMVYKRILSPSQNKEVGHGCVADHLPRTDVLAEAKKWKTLAPGSVYEFTVPLRSTLLLNADGRYELNAKYYPPYLTSAELSILAENGIVVPRQVVVSPPIIVQPEAH